MPASPHLFGTGRFGARAAALTVSAALIAAAPAPFTAAPAAAATTAHPSTYVDPFIGSTNGGNTFPGATAPHSMIAWSPTSTKGDQTDTAAAGGYSYDTTRTRGLSLTHVNGAGCHPGAAGDVPIMPFAGDVTSSPSADTKDAVYASDFSHANERATPGRYSVTLDSGVGADLAVTERAGVGDFTFPSGKPASLLFRVSNSLNGSEDARIDIDEKRHKVTGSVLTGAFCGRRANGGTNNRKSYYRLYFTASFDRAFSTRGTWKDGTLSPGSTSGSGGEGYATGADRAGRGSGGWVGFDPSADNDVHMRLGISYVSLDGAEANLREEIEPRASVDAVAAATARSWDKELGSVRTGGGSEDRRTTFYTAMYHALMQPGVVNDTDGRYPGMDGKPHRLAKGQRAQYSNFSGWDQYRAQIQLLALLEPEVAGDFAQSLYNFSEQNGGVWDRWVHINGATHVMTGDPSAATLATFYAMGVRNFDYRGAFDSLARQATEPNDDGLSDAGCPGQCTGQRPNLGQYLTSHYAAQDTCHCWGGAAETLEDAVADSALGRWAKLLGRDKQAAEFSERGSWWRNVFNSEATDGAGTTGYIQARNLDGSWVTPFDPGSDRGFAQGTSATYTWMVPQDVRGLAERMGGPSKAAERLDAFFHKPDGSWSVKGGDALRYDPTNEPGIHAPWLYNALGQPWKTQETVRQILDTVYGTGPAGLPGNDDLGTMSAWYVFSALGLYPRTPGSASMLLGAPLFPHAVIDRPGRTDIRIEAPLADSAHPYVSALHLNGRTYDRSWTDGSLLRSGGTLAYRLSDRPDTRWATAESQLPR
ncbi:GH92 family glycosyl hydrolase [Streptomyces tsukubensis]|uniref:Alpha-mannosidase n=1 Tax=Streptomyces tsukubensis TaxID=83656 RepID=A0A1V4AFZ3_9ACTN|nr:GH92 family glycosyl hydrolase [Streptomyces tsukubensis]OON82939.1 alpha-mannosidase [Streptomyces tsukubensis]QFR91875.1 glycoside hydrolase family 92 protein [Streptomyces tsukubensis]